jgi:hypothetical protein
MHIEHDPISITGWWHITKEKPASMMVARDTVMLFEWIELVGGRHGTSGCWCKMSETWRAEIDLSASIAAVDSEVCAMTARAAALSSPAWKQFTLHSPKSLLWSEIPARQRRNGALLDGRARTSTELAYAAGVSPQTSSGHLAKMTDGRLLSLTRQGRHS